MSSSSLKPPWPCALIPWARSYPWHLAFKTSASPRHTLNLAWEAQEKEVSF